MISNEHGSEWPGVASKGGEEDECLPDGAREVERDVGKAEGFGEVGRYTAVTNRSRSLINLFPRALLRA